MVGSLPQHHQPAPEARGSNDRDAADNGRIAPSGLHRRHQNARRMGMEEEDARCRLPSPVALGLSWHRCDYTEIRAIEVSDKVTGDEPMPLCLLNLIAADESVANASGGGA